MFSGWLPAGDLYNEMDRVFLTNKLHYRALRPAADHWFPGAVVRLKPMVSITTLTFKTPSSPPFLVADDLWNRLPLITRAADRNDTDRLVVRESGILLPDTVKDAKYNFTGTATLKIYGIDIKAGLVTKLFQEAEVSFDDEKVVFISSGTLRNVGGFMKAPDLLPADGKSGGRQLYMPIEFVTVSGLTLRGKLGSQQELSLSSGELLGRLGIPETSGSFDVTVTGESSAERVIRVKGNVPYVIAYGELIKLTPEAVAAMKGRSLSSYEFEKVVLGSTPAPALR